MQVAYAVAAVLHAAFAIVLVAVGDPPKLTLTVRRQFDSWTPLLDVFRSATLNNSEALRHKALAMSWCNETLPPRTTRAPYCRCVARASDKFSNSTQDRLQSARDDAVMDIVGCLRDRPVWRVWPIWGVRYSTPAVYAVFVAACFLWVAANLPPQYTTIPLWVLAVVLVITLVVRDFVHNGFWAFTFILVMLLIDWILVPGMAPLGSDEQDGLARTPSCFWWSEYLSAPIFALYTSLMHCGRDIYFTAIFLMIGTAVGGLGLRSFWCGQAYAEKPRFILVMQNVVWLGILASCIALSFITGIYYQSSVPYNMGPASVALLSLTFVVSLLQWPGNQNFRMLLFTQMSVAAVRNLLLIGIVAADSLV